MEENYIIHCPQCGDFRAYFPENGQGEETENLVEDDVIEMQEFESFDGPVSRIRCPRCGTWLDADRMEAA